MVHYSGTFRPMGCYVKVYEQHLIGYYRVPTAGNKFLSDLSGKVDSGLSRGISIK